MTLCGGSRPRNSGFARCAPRSSEKSGWPRCPGRLTVLTVSRKKKKKRFDLAPGPAAFLLGKARGTPPLPFLLSSLCGPAREARGEGRLPGLPREAGRDRFPVL